MSGLPPGSAVNVETRTGNSEEPDDTWSDWVPAAADAAISSPAARFLQWRAILRSDGQFFAGAGLTRKRRISPSTWLRG